jgi:hypothetical protein
MLGLKTHRATNNSSSWKAPFRVDVEIRAIEQSISAASCKLAYVRGVTSIYWAKISFA